MSDSKKFYFFLQNSYAPDPDPEMTIDNYERSFEQNDDLGLNDMKTENYGENDDLESGKPLQFRPNSNWRGCCAKSRLLMDIGQSGRYLITRETPPGGYNLPNLTQPSIDEKKFHKVSTT